MKRWIEGALLAVALLPTGALAKGKAAKHVCMKDGTEVTDATDKKASKAAGGKWEKEKAPAPAAGESTSTTGSATP